MHGVVQKKLYRAATTCVAQCKELCYSIMLIKYQASSHKSIQQRIIFLRVHQYVLIEQSANVHTLWRDALNYYIEYSC